MFFNKDYNTTILVVRHGQSLGNAAEKFLGHTDMDLSPLGYRQAYKTLDFLSEVNIDKVYSSSLLRAYHTVKPHADIRGIEVITSDELRELYAGIWENCYINDLKSEYGDTYSVEWRRNFPTFRIPGGESCFEGGQRLYNKILDIAKENVGKTILIGCHAGVMRCGWCYMTGEPFGETLSKNYDFPDNASVSVLYFDGEKLIPGIYSYSEHLKDCK